MVEPKLYINSHSVPYKFFIFCMDQKSKYAYTTGHCLITKIWIKKELQNLL